MPEEMITPTQTFRLTPAAAPGFSQLFAGDKCVENQVAGVDLEAEYQVTVGQQTFYLLLITDNVPYEEGLHLYLIDDAFKLAEQKNIGAPYTPGILTVLDVIQPNAVAIDFQGKRKVTVLQSPRGFLRRRRLDVSPPQY